ncbi:MAG: glycosyl hydrolase 108 family protein [Paracoccus sp. (in: a-proteobacteria)]|nr:glycosyl hydrolase 108 family protein [Paracoccus sp. (in: a-proteobacteria)]
MANDADFSRALAQVKEYEGGWSNHAADPGGLTKWGITIVTLRALGLDFNRDGRTDAADLRAMTPEQAAGVYRRNYWQAARCPDLPAPLAFLVFDSAVNQGVGRAVRLLQAAVGAKVDGAFGPATLRAVNAAWVRDPLGLLAEFQARRGVHYGSLGIFKHFGLGWMRRLIGGHGVAVRWHLGVLS